MHRSARHERLTWPIWYAFDEQYLLPLSHDEVVHLKKALLTKMPGDDWQRFANLRALYAYQYAHGKKLLFMGGEPASGGVERGAQPGLAPPGGGGRRGQPGPPAPGATGHAAGPEPPLRYPQRPAPARSQPRGFDWIEHGDVQHSVIAFLRRGLEPGDVVAAVCNFTPVVREGYPIGVPVPGSGRRSSTRTAPATAGRDREHGRVPAGGARPAQAGALQHLRLTLPPLSVLYLRPREE